MADDAAQNSARDLTSPHSNPVQGGISTPTQSKAGFQSAPQCLHEKHNKQFLCSNGDDCSASFKLLPYLVRANFLRSEPYDSVFFSLSNVTFEKNF